MASTKQGCNREPSPIEQLIAGDFDELQTKVARERRNTKSFFQVLRTQIVVQHQRVEKLERGLTALRGDLARVISDQKERDEKRRQIARKLEKSRKGSK